MVWRLFQVIGSLLLLIGAPALVIDPGADRALPCPVGELLASAIAERRPGVEIEAGSAAHHDALLVSIEPVSGGDRWTLALLRAEGSRALAREVSLPPSGCGGLAHTFALMIDRYLTEIAALQQHSPPARIEPSAEVSPRLILGAGVAIAARGEPLVPALGPELFARLAFDSGLELGLRAAIDFPPGRSVVLADPLVGSVVLGSIRVIPSFALGSVGRCWFAPVQLCADATAGAAVEWISVEGSDLHRTGSRVLVSPLVGAAGSLRLPLGEGFQLRAELSTRLHLTRPQASIEGLPDPIYRGSWVELGSSVGLAREIF